MYKSFIYLSLLIAPFFTTGCGDDEATEESSSFEGGIPFVGGIYDNLAEEYAPMPSPSEYVFPAEGGRIEIVSQNEMPGMTLGFLPVWDAVDGSMPPVETAGIIDWVDKQKGLYFQEKDGWRLENTVRGTIILTVGPNPEDSSRIVGCTRVYSSFGTGVRFSSVNYKQNGVTAE